MYKLYTYINILNITNSPDFSSPSPWRQAPFGCASPDYMPPGVIKYGWLENPQSNGGFIAEKIIELNGSFSSHV